MDKISDIRILLCALNMVFVTLLIIKCDKRNVARVFSEMKKIVLPLPEDHSMTVRTLHTQTSTQ